MIFEYLSSRFNVSRSFSHSGHIAATTISFRPGLFGTGLRTWFDNEDLHPVQIMAVIEVVLGLRGPDFLLVHVDDVHLEGISGFPNNLEIH